MLSKNFYHCSHCSTGPEYFSQKIFSSNTLFWMLVLPLTTFFKELMLGLLIFLTSLAAFKRFSAITHPATGPPGDVVTTSLLSPSNVIGTSQMKHQRRLSGTSPRRVSGSFHNVLMVCREDVSRERNDDAPSLRLHDVSNKSQMKHPKTSQWYVSTTSH